MKFAISIAFLLAASVGIGCASAADPIQLLETNDIRELDAELSGIQARFEAGSLSETELRAAFRPFYDLDAVAAANLRSWAASNEKSYVAHLALGIYYKRRGTAARGTRFIAQTPRADLERMGDYFGLAELELRNSLELSPKPFLSIYHLQTIALARGDHAESRALLDHANRVLPTNLLARARYATTLTPRWGGSYEQLEAFAQETEAQHAPPAAATQIRAIALDDLAKSLDCAGDVSAALEHAKRALELGVQAGGTFADEYLGDSRRIAQAGAAPPSPCR